MRHSSLTFDLASLYRRYGAGYVRWTVLVGYAAALVFLLLMAALAGRLTGIGFTDTLRGALVLGGYATLAFVFAVRHQRSELEALRSWASGQAGEGAVARARTAKAAFALPRRVIITTLPYLSAGPFLAAWLFGYDDGAIDWGNALGAGGGACFVLLYGSMLAYHCVELLIQPVRRDIGETVTRSEFTSSGTLSITAKVLAGFATTALAVGFITAATVAPTGDWAEAWTTLAVMVTASATLGLSMAVLVTRNALGPIANLRRSTARVTEGKLDSQVPVTSTDELGELAVAFNEMLEGLQERESLRQRNLELVDEVRASRARIVTAADESRRSVERDLHDGAQQNLVLLNLELGLVGRAVADDPKLTAMVDEARSNLDRALSELRDLAHGIYPAVLTNDGLVAALSEAAEKSALRAEVKSEAVGRYPSELEAAVYFCCLEALQNAAKHAGPDARAVVTVTERGGEARFEVADDGAGFDSDSARESAGIQNMADRIGALGGALAVESAPGRGTTVTGWVPVRR